jgi:glycogen debranching enzyme
MSNLVQQLELVEVPPPYKDSKLAVHVPVPREVENLTLIDGKTFLATRLAGDIVSAGAADVGFFHDDTRFLSCLELRVGGRPTMVLSSNTEKSFASQIELTTEPIRTRDSFEIPENTIHIRRQQLLKAETMFDRFSLVSFNREDVEVRVELRFDADFVDVFQVRGTKREVSGTYYHPVRTAEGLSFYYLGRDNVLRQTQIKFNPLPDQIEEKSAVWNVRLSPLTHSEIEVSISPIVGEEPDGRASYGFSKCLSERRTRFFDWENSSTRFSSNNSTFDAALATATADYHALQIRDDGKEVLGAGIPWFATLFGRDSIIAAYQALALNPNLATDTLQVLARYQGKQRNDWQDEDPGKILHEFRQGEMTRCSELPFGPYYGSVDSTPLFLVLLCETYRWTADREGVKRLLPAAYAALDWIDNYGDLDGDGFVEWKRRSPKGLVNQAWKDSWDAYMRPDRSIPPYPLASVEVQGYVYDAKFRMARLLREFGDNAGADRLQGQAEQLAKKVNEAFWMPELQYFAMALDGNKEQLGCITSNPGHLLFSRAVNPDRVQQIVDRLMYEDMASGWGWRTLSRDEPTFNPMSYHRGSVWPHENSLIAHGMALHEYREPVRKVMTALFQAALNFRAYRLPELFCGVQRREHDQPVHYPVSCSPQAWASGAWFLLLTSILGIRPNAPQKELNIVNPELPEWLNHLQIRNLRIGESRVALDFVRDSDRTYCNVVKVEGEPLLVNVAFKK